MYTKPNEGEDLRIYGKISHELEIESSHFIRRFFPSQITKKSRRCQGLCHESLGITNGKDHDALDWIEEVDEVSP